MNIRSWRVRDYVKVLLGVCLTVLSVKILFPRVDNNFSCDDSVPANAVEKAALDEVRSMMSGTCASAHRCKFVIADEEPQSFSINSMIVHSDFFEGCVYDSANAPVYVYNREGKVIRIDHSNYD